MLLDPGVPSVCAQPQSHPLCLWTKVPALAQWSGLCTLREPSVMDRVVHANPIPNPFTWAEGAPTNYTDEPDTLVQVVDPLPMSP